MKQVCLVAPEKFEVREVEMPKCGENQALLKVHAVGICGSDIHAYYGKHPFMSCPIVLGHEAAGEVVEVGKNVTNVKVGMRVVMRPQDICHECYNCRHGRYNICNSLKVIGCQETGASSEYFAVDADLLYEIPDKCSYGEGTVIEPLAVGIHAVKRGAPEVAGLKVLVIGAGTIGNLVAQSAKGLGAAKVMITDVADLKLEMAKDCGIDVCVNVARQNLQEEMKKAFGEDGADVIYECSGNAGALNQTLEYARKGINIVTVAVYAGTPAMNMPNVQDREYNLVGTLMYMEDDYFEAIRLIKEDKVNVGRIITAHFPLEKTAEAYKTIEANREAMQKVILDV